METIDKIVRFDKWCSKCKYAKDDEFSEESKCYDCLYDATSEHSDKPTYYEEEKHG